MLSYGDILYINATGGGGGGQLIGRNGGSGVAHTEYTAPQIMKQEMKQECQILNQLCVWIYLAAVLHRGRTKIP